jgi:hydrogenase expression/formation protein HypE
VFLVVYIASGKNIEIGDKLIINGAIGDHGMAIMSARNFSNIKNNIQSDCACLNGLINKAMHASSNIKFMRDVTRGGLSTVICEILENRNFGIDIIEETVPVHEDVRGMCELLGFDPFYVANEGKVLMIVAAEDAENVLNILKE